MHKGRRSRMPVDDFAFARGATAAITSKQEAEKVWEPKFIAEIASGKDPRVAPGRPTTAGQPTTDNRCRTLCSLSTAVRRGGTAQESPHRVESAPILTSELGQLPTKALERPEAVEDFKARCSCRALATTNRYLARLGHVCNWAIGRELLTATPFHRRGLRIVTKNERRRDRRISEAEEQRLLNACRLLNDLPLVSHLSAKRVLASGDSRNLPRCSRKWWRGTESNCRHYDFQSYALPTELPRHAAAARPEETAILARGLTSVYRVTAA